MEQSLPCGDLNEYLYTHWKEQLKKELSDRLGRETSYVDHRNQIRIRAAGEDTYYTLRLVAGTDEYDVNAEDLVITLMLNFHSDILSLIHCHRYGDGSKGLPNLGVEVDQNLLPKLYNDEKREAEAERFLKLYCPEALEKPMPVPIRDIMEQQMGLHIMAEYNIPESDKNRYRYGFTMFEDQVVDLLDGDKPTPFFLERGTVVVDSDTALFYGVGAMNYTLGHEAYHWFAHRPYVDFHKLIGKQEGESYNGSSQYSAAQILEIQSQAMASWILLPKKPFTEKYRELSAKESDIHKVISALADFFKVSYSAATYRIKDLGFAYFTTPCKTSNVTPMDAYELYEDKDFRKLVDSQKIVYTAGHYVFNEPKYVSCIWNDVPRYEETKDRENGPYRLTDYALSHPDEAFLTFTIDHKSVAEDGKNGILNRESAACLKADVAAFKEHCPHDAEKVKKEADAFEKAYETHKGEHLSFCELASRLITYRYGRQEDFNAKARERRWNPERDMPEVKEKYFSSNDWIQKMEKERLEIWDNEDISYDDTEVIDNICTEEIRHERERDRKIEERYRDNLTTRIYDENNGKIIEEASSPIRLFCDDTYQGRNVYTSIMKGTAGNPEPKKLMSLCVGMCLSPKVSAALFASAGRVLTWDKENMAYRYILTNLRGVSVTIANAFLDELGLNLIGASTLEKKDQEEKKKAGQKS